MQPVHPDSLEVVLELENFVDATDTESETMADDEYDWATVNDFATRNMAGVQSCIKMPEMRAHNFEIKPVMTLCSSCTECSMGFTMKMQTSTCCTS